MSTPRIPEPAQLVISLFSSRLDHVWERLKTELEKKFGPLDYISTSFAFTETGYYIREFGSPLFRRILGFERLVDQDLLPEVKLTTNELENSYVSEGLRLFNLDPGLLTLERLVLATGKNFTHRVYLHKGIWADLTLIFQKGRWHTLPWTFPDYGGHIIQDHLTTLRTRYKEKLK